MTEIIAAAARPALTAPGMTSSAPATSQPATPGSPYRWVVIIGLVSVVNSAAMLVSLSVGITLPEMREDFGMSPTQAGILGATSPLAMILLSVPVAALVSRYNPRWTVFGAAVYMSIFALLMAWSPNYPSLLAFRFLFMVGLVSRQANMAMLIQQWFENKEVPRVQSVMTVIMSSVQIGAFAALPWLLIWLSGWRNTFSALAVLMAISAVTWALLSRNGTREQPLPRADGRRDPTPVAAIFQHRIIWYWGVATAFCLVGVSAFMTFWPTYLVEERGLSLQWAGIIAAGIPLGNVVGALHASTVRGRVTQRKQQMYITGVMCSSSMVVMTLLPIPFLLPLAAFGLGWACMQVYPTILTLPYELPSIRPREVAVVSAFLFSLFTLGPVIGPILTGVVQQATGSLTLAFLIVPAVHLGIFIVAFASESGLPPMPRIVREREAAESALAAPDAVAEEVAA